MRQRSTRKRRTALALTLTLGLSACSPTPFDANAPWVPWQSGEGASFAGDVQAQAPDMGFSLFERDRLPAETVSIPQAGDENPWATPIRNVVVAVCYGSVFNDAESVKATARGLCPPNARLRLLGQDTVWNDCPLLQPQRAVFRCVPPGDAELGALRDRDGAGDGPD